MGDESAFASGYNHYEQRFKRQLIRYSFIIGIPLCAFYAYQNSMASSYFDALSNFLVLASSIVGLLLMRKNLSLNWLYLLPAFNFLMLFLGSFVGPGPDDNSGLLWCLLFISLLILVLGHLRSLPVLLLIFAIVYYQFYIAPGTWLNSNYTHAEQDNFLIAGILLALLTLFFEFTRYRLSRKIYQQHRQMSYLSSHDELSTLYNRRGLLNEIKKLKLDGQRQTDQYAFILLDIDNFKEINDNFGHETGDEVIRTLADVMKKNVRANDLIARWGGEEFLIFINHSQQNEIERIADDLCLRIAQQSLSFNARVLQVSVSIGVSFSYETSDFNQLMKIADRRLYQAKKNGKNQVVFQDP